MKKLLTLLLLTSFSFIQAQSVLIKDATVVDVENGRLITNQHILVENGTILQMSSKKIKNKGNIQELDAKGKYLIPGMIDTHIHFFQTGSLYTRPDALDMRHIKSYDEELDFAMDMTTDSFTRYLRLGITSVMDVGGPFSNFKVRDDIAINNLSPNVYVTGPLFSPYQPEAFADSKDTPIAKINTIEQADVLFNKMLPFKPDFIKIWYIASKDEPAEKNFPVVQHIANLAHKNNLKLAVHATQLNTAQLAVDAGADILVHSVGDKPVSEGFIASLLKNDVTYIPTLIVSKNYPKAFLSSPSNHPQDLAFANPTTYGSMTDLKGISEKDIPQSIKGLKGNGDRVLAYYDNIIQRMNGNLKLLSERGVNIAAGTDAGNIGTMHASSYIQELEAMERANLSPATILKYATINAAKGFGLDSELGTIEEGKRADLVLLTANPLDDLQALNKIDEVIKDGQILNVKNMLNESPEQIVQRQLIAYNAGNIEAFLSTFAEDVKAYEFPNKLIMEGKEKFREVYGKKFKENPSLHSKLLNRTVLDNKVIDTEQITSNSLDYTIIAIYEISNGKIVKATFLK